MNKKQLFIWSLYDFANSIVMIVFFLYYSQWLVVDRGVSDFWFNFTFVASSILLLLTAPVAGSITDKIKVKMPSLKAVTALSFIFFVLTGIIASFYPGQYILSAVTFTLATYFYLFSFVFYNSLLDDVARPECHGLASGWGQFGNWMGQIFGLLITLPLVTGAVTLWGEPGRSQALIPASVLFLLFSLPTFLLFKEKSVRVHVQIDLAKEYRSVWSSFVELCKTPNLGYFFLAYFFFNDAVITASNNFPIFLEKVFGVNDSIKSYLLIAILITSAIGAPVSGWVADKIGLKKTLMGILIGWIIIFPLMAITTDFTLFILISAIMGIWFGSIWTVTRAIVTQLTPDHLLNRSFAYYTLMERFATFIGPLSWGLIVSQLPTHDGFNYRSAIMAMTLFVVAGLIIARKIPNKVSASL